MRDLIIKIEDLNYLLKVLKQTSTVVGGMDVKVKLSLVSKPVSATELFL